MPDTQSRDVAEAEREMESTADDLEEGRDELEGEIGDAKKTIEQNKDLAGEADSAVMPTAAGDVEDEDPGPMEADPAGFDDPESLDLDEDFDEDLEDDDGHGPEED